MEKVGGGSSRNRTFSGNEFIAGERCKDVGIQNSFNALGQDNLSGNKFSAGERCQNVGIKDSFNG